MKKATVEAHAYQTRSGNHSITHSRRGDSSHLTNEVDISYVIDSAADEVTKQKTIQEKREFLVWEKIELTKRLGAIKAKLAYALPMEKFKELNIKRQECVKQITEIEVELKKISDCRAGTNIGRSGHFGDLFKEIARECLPAHVYEEILVKTKQADSELRWQKQRQKWPQSKT